jgi:hypothetical protein
MTKADNQTELKETEKSKSKKDWCVFVSFNFSLDIQVYDTLLLALLAGMKRGNKSQQRWLPDSEET